MLSAYILKPIANIFHQRFDKWLSKHIPKKSHQQLSRKNIFIFPSKFGLAFLSFILLLFILGTNYQNNIILLLSYLLVSFFVIEMLHNFYNLSGIVIESKKLSQGYADQPLAIDIIIASNKTRFDYYLQFPAQKLSHQTELVVGKNTISVPFLSSQRGLYELGRLKVFSHYGFGLFVTWTHLDLAIKALVYPAPLAFEILPTTSSLIEIDQTQSANLTNTSMKQGADEFFALKNYQQGDSYHHVAWKQVAKGQGWYTKQYAQQNSKKHHLSLQNMPSQVLEVKLQQLCFLILQYHQLAEPFAVQLYEKHIPSGYGEIHLQECLAALATFGSEA